MSKTTRIVRRKAALVVLGALAVVMFGGTALAGHITSNVKSYTGCLVGGDGVIIKVAEGNSPKSACTGGQTQVHLSGGDITSVSPQTGGGLAGGGNDGAVSLSVRRDCDNSAILKWNGSAWMCGADNNSTYVAGTGLDLTGSTFNIEPAYRLPGKACGTSGQFARGFDGNGDIQCAAAASSTGIEVWQKTGTQMNLPKGEGVDLIIMPLPAGTYLVTAAATLRDDGGTINGDEEVSVQCGLRNAAFTGLPLQDTFVDIGEATDDNNGPAGTGVIHGVLTFTTADSVRFTCLSTAGDSEPDEAFNTIVTAVKVGVVHTP